MYGKDRKIASKKEYANILPERMAAHPTINLGAPKIKIIGDKADWTRNNCVMVTFSMDKYQAPTTFYLVRKSGKWFIMSWEY